MRVDAAASAASFYRAPAGALLDFAAEARLNGARVLENFSILNVGGVNVEVASGSGALSPLFQPCLDAAGGLGVRKSPETGAREEVVQITFLNSTSTAHARLTVTSLSFRDAESSPVGPTNDGAARVITDNGSATGPFSRFMARAAEGDPFFANTRFVLFGFAERPFHISAIGVREAPVPPPPPLLQGAAGLGFAARRRQRALGA